MFGRLRALITRRFIEHQIRTLNEEPGLAINAKLQISRREICFGFTSDFLVDGHRAARNQLAAFTPRAEAL